MTIYYIDNSSASASDRNAGISISSPFASFAALSKVTFQPGNTVLVKAGTRYNNASTINLTAIGTANQFITITSYGSGAKPVINNTSGAMYGDVLELKSSSYVTISGLAFAQAGEAAVNIDVKSNHIIVKNNEMTNVGEGVLLNGSSSTVTQNYIHDLHMVKNTPTDHTSAATIAATDNDDYGANGVVIGGSNDEISLNKIVNAQAPSYDYGVDGGGFEICSSVSNIYIHDNYVYKSNGFIEVGLYGNAISAIKIYNNVSFNSGDFSVIHNTSGSKNTFYDFIMNNNTIVNTNNSSKAMATFMLDAPATSNQVSINSNIVSLNDGDSVFKQQGSNHSKNVFNLKSKSTHLYNNWSMVLGSGEKFEDPGLNNVSNGNFTPTLAGLSQTTGAVMNAQLQAVISRATGLAD